MFIIDNKEVWECLLTFDEKQLERLSLKFNIKNEDDLYDAVVEMINTYMEL